MFAYCNNNPTNYTDDDGQFALVDDVLIISAVYISIIPIVILAVTPPSVVQNVFIDGLNRIADEFANAIEHSANILEAKTKGKERMKDSGLAEESDEEIQRKARDKSLPKSEQQRYKTEEKARGLRNRRKRNDMYQ